MDTCLHHVCIAISPPGLQAVETSQLDTINSAIDSKLRRRKAEYSTLLLLRSPLQRAAPQYLAKWFSKTNPLAADIPPFHYRHLGSMAQVGDWKAVADLKGIGGSGGGDGAKQGPVLEGLLAFATWRSAYWTKTVR